MPRGTEVPITPEVLSWAIKQSGHDEETVASKLNVPVEEVRRWIFGEARPLKTKFRRLAEILKRPTALFFLPEPPQLDHSPIAFRHPTDSDRNQLNPKELRYIREIRRLQDTLSWARGQLDETFPELERWSQSTSPESAATSTRKKIGIDLRTQFAWKTASKAQEGWREAIEARGVLVFFLPMGEESVRGFSLWHETSPAIAVNTWWNNQARIFSLFHEYGHLLTRSSSACFETPKNLKGNKSDSIERWCEQFAASVILPWDDMANFIKSKYGWPRLKQIDDLEQLYAIARKFKVSARATALRLINHNFATWDLYNAIPAASDQKKGRGGGKGRTRVEIRRDEYGKGVTQLFVRAVDRELISRTDALGFLKVSDSDFDHWRA